MYQNVVSPTKQQKDMTDGTPVYQRIARITRATTSTNRLHGYTGGSSGGIVGSLQTTLPHSRAFCIQTVEQALGYKSSSSRKRVAFQAGLARSSR